MENKKLAIGDIYLVTDTTNTDFCQHWYDNNTHIEFKTKTTKPVLYIVVENYPGSSNGYLDLRSLNPKSQFKSADNTPDNLSYVTGYGKDKYERLINSLQYLGTEEIGDLWWHQRDEIYKKWSKLAKEKGFFKEEPVEGYLSPKDKHIELALDFIGQEVKVGDTVAYVLVSWGQGFKTGIVDSITKDSFVVGGYARPHNQVIKVDPNKIRR